MARPEQTPRYLEIRRDLESRIMSGEWQPGHRVPSEQALTEQFGCSRMTVNKAVSALAEAGLVVRRRRSGSFVAAPQSQETILDIPDIKREILATGRSYRHTILTRLTRAATREDRVRLGLDEPVRVCAVTLVHCAAEVPFAFEDRLINLAEVPLARAEAFLAEPPGTWLLAHIPWSRAEHRIRAVAGSAAIARVLGIREGAACLTIERRTWQSGLPITHARLVYPGERHELVARFSPDP